MFKKAEKSKSKLRLAIDGVSGSGKTYSSLILAQSLGSKIAVLDTEHGSASLYSDKFDFDVVEMTAPYSPEKYIEVIAAAEKSGYEVLIIDSLSHEWSGEGGCLDIQAKLGGRFQDWAKVTPRHTALINKILSSKLHIIATMRSKSDYAISNDNSKAKVTKLGTAAIQRDGMEYEFTINFSLNLNHLATATKDRTGMFDGKDFEITSKIGDEILEWLNSGKDILDQKTNYSELVNIQELEARAMKNAESGIDNLKSFFSGLERHHQAALKPYLEKIKKMCPDYIQPTGEE